MLLGCFAEVICFFYAETKDFTSTHALDPQRVLSTFLSDRKSVSRCIAEIRFMGQTSNCLPRQIWEVEIAQSRYHTVIKAISRRTDQTNFRCFEATSHHHRKMRIMDSGMFSRLCTSHLTATRPPRTLPGALTNYFDDDPMSTMTEDRAAQAIRKFGGQFRLDLGPKLAPDRLFLGAVAPHTLSLPLSGPYPGTKPSPNRTHSA